MLVRQRAALLLLAVAAMAMVDAHAADQKLPTNDKLPEWAPKPKPRVAEDRLRVEVTLLSANVSTDLRVDQSATLRGTQVSAEDDLGLADFRLMPQAEFTLLPGDHHLVRLSALALHRSAHKIIDKEIFFDDQVYLPTERVDSRLNLTMVGLTYGYRFIVRDRGELTGTFGIQVADVEANAVVRRRVIREPKTGVAPLPLAGVEGRFDFTPRWSVEARVQYLTVNISDVDGSILDARLALTWRVNPYLAFGLGYRDLSIKVDSHDTGTPGFVDLKIAGPLLFMRASM